MATLDNTLLPSLSPWPTKEEQVVRLQEVIGRIFAERGHFRNITEESLLEEISRQKLEEAPTTLVDSSDVEGETQDDSDDKPQNVYAARSEVLALVSYVTLCSCVMMKLNEDKASSE